MAVHEKKILSSDGLNALLRALAERGHRVVGPTVRDGAIVYDDVASIADLPRGWRDRQEAGHYRLERRDDDALFGHVVGPHSWKRFLHPPMERLWRAQRDGDRVEVEGEPAKQESFAFIGMRSCEIHAIAVQDRVFLEGPHVDARYETRRQGNFFVAVNCAEPGGTCFCASMGTGPKAETGFDLALTELGRDGARRYLVEVGSEAGEEVISALPCRDAAAEDVAEADELMAGASAAMGREMPAAGELRDLLTRNLEHPRWDEVAGRCLSCANCTMVCPTCFCTSVEDSSDLTGLETARTQRWDSCFTMDFSYIHGGSVRPSIRSRYRQWMTHKLATWHDQFGTSGCVGCGRCITWCPVGIDITEEVGAIRATDREGGR